MQAIIVHTHMLGEEGNWVESDVNKGEEFSKISKKKRKRNMDQSVASRHKGTKEAFFKHSRSKKNNDLGSLLTLLN